MDAVGRTLVLVKHAMPTLVPGVPAASWTLSDAGRRACAPLAARLAEHDSAVIVTSTEPKAAETGRLVAAALNLPDSTAPGLHEHDAGETPLLGETAWRATIARFFAEPDALVFGRETAAQAGQRFAEAVAAAVDGHATGTTVIVAHGRVISLFVAQTNPVDPFALWGELGLPSFVVLSWPGRVLRTVAGRVE